MLMFAALPAGTTYKLQSYGMGSGGVANATSSSYAMEAISGETSGLMTGTTYDAGAGLIPTQLANVPDAPTLQNNAFLYNKLRIIMNTGNNPSDATLAVAISTDDFVTTQYVQSDFTIGSALGIEDYQTYTAWGGATGVYIIGLSPNTTYKVASRAMQGKFTESKYSAIATAATINPALTFDLDTAATDIESAAPYNVTFTDLLPATAVMSTQRIWIDFETNGETGGNLYMYGQNGGLTSVKASHTIPSATADLTVAGRGFGARTNSVTQSAGGPLDPVSPYDVGGGNVGIVDTSIRTIYTSASPLSAGRASMRLGAKVTAITPSASDYTEILTIVAAANF